MKLNRLLSIIPALCAGMHSDPYSLPKKTNDDRMSFNKEYRGKQVHRPDSEFIIHGVKIIAKSRIDAIKKYKRL